MQKNSFIGAITSRARINVKKKKKISKATDLVNYWSLELFQ